MRQAEQLADHHSILRLWLRPVAYGAAVTHRRLATLREVRARSAVARLRSTARGRPPGTAAGSQKRVGSDMRLVELVGYLASALVFATFCVKAMPPLRFIAIASNVAFMTYGYLGGMAPILLLHAVLLPLNARRLYQALRPGNELLHGGEPARLSTKFLRLRNVSRQRTGTPGTDTGDHPPPPCLLRHPRCVR